MVRIIFVCTFIFYFFVLRFSFSRIIFEIRDKKEERKDAVEFSKRQTKMLKHFAYFHANSKKSG